MNKVGLPGTQGGRWPVTDSTNPLERTSHIRCPGGALCHPHSEGDPTALGKGLSQEASGF